jgi:hypothetical protein
MHKQLFFNKLCKNSNKISNQKIEKKERKRTHLKANEFKGLEKHLQTMGFKV